MNAKNVLQSGSTSSQAAKEIRRNCGERSTPKPPEELNDVLGCSSSGGGPKSKEEKKARSREAAATTTTTGPQR